MKLEKYSQSLQILDEAVDVDSSYLYFYFNRILCNIFLGDTLKAFEDAESCISIDSNSNIGYIMRDIYIELQIIIKKH